MLRLILLSEISSGHMKVWNYIGIRQISWEPTDRIPVLSFPVFDPLLVWQEGGRPRDALNRPVLPPSVVVVPLPPTEIGAVEVNIAPLLIRNRGRLRAGRAQQGLRNTPDRELENTRTNEDFQVPRGRLQGNRARGERGNTRRAKRGSGARGTRRNLSAFD